MVIFSDLIRYCCVPPGAVDFWEFAFVGAGIELPLFTPDEVVPAVDSAPQPATSTARITRPAMKKVVHEKLLTLCGIVPLLLKLIMVGYHCIVHDVERLE
jgi:hypothetical protein